ncbi:CU044_5270 family protein [Streptomyces sp. NPDC101490]|uniref:CU044_5270 family protein n=1 Tax=Streptomyces sp. NPDC101490 TaxID=3366143 RepID=UPI003823E8A6
MNTPNGFKQRLGAELALLERARAEGVAEETAGHGMRVAARRVFARPAVRRTAFVGLAAGTVAAVVITAWGGPGTQTRPVRAMTVAQVLDAAAVNASKGSDEEPGPHQWVYTGAVVCDSFECGRRSSWARYDGVKVANLEKSPATGGRTVVSVGDTFSLPEMVGGRLQPPKVGDRPQETREVLSGLPTDPRELLERVSTDPFFARGHDPSAIDPPVEGQDSQHNFWKIIPPAVTPGAQFARIVYILRSVPNIPPQVNAALYRALALIPGVDLASAPMRDAAGRSGITIAFEFQDRHRTRAYLFLDADTYAYHGSRRDWPGENPMSESYARVATDIVDHPGQMPGGPAPAPSDVVERPPIIMTTLKPR